MKELPDSLSSQSSKDNHRTVHLFTQCEAQSGRFMKKKVFSEKCLRIAYASSWDRMTAKASLPTRFLMLCTYIVKPFPASSNHLQPIKASCALLPPG